MKSVGEEVLSVYKRESPSAISIEDKKVFEGFTAYQSCLWQDRLKLPLRMFHNMSFVDFGCGTGEIDVFLALNGAHGKGVDFNEISIERAKTLSKHFKMHESLSFEIGDIHKHVYPQLYDLGVCHGVLPHVEDPKLVVSNIADSVKKNGFICIGFVEELGLIQRLLHRSIIRAVKGLDEEKIINLAKKLFPDHINRSKKYGQRNERQIVFNYLVNRHLYGIKLETMLSWFNEYGIKFYSSYPSIEIPFTINPYTSERLPIEHNISREFRALLRLRWLFTQFEDDRVFSNYVTKETNEFIHAIDELSTILSELVQSEPWEKSSITNVKEALHSTEKLLKGRVAQLTEYILKSIEVCSSSLIYVLEKIIGLQNGEISDFEMPLNLFRELNGISTFYIVGIKE